MEEEGFFRIKKENRHTCNEILKEAVHRSVPLTETALIPQTPLTPHGHIWQRFAVT